MTSNNLNIRQLCLLILISLLISIMITVISARTSDSLRITLPSINSKLIGRHLTSHSGRGIRAFMGIPYAEPPVGPLRFRPPVPHGPWDGERHATKDSSICIQRDPFRRDDEIEGSEDCLYLNVYTPQFPDIQSNLLPVMVFFHGGGWECGSGISAFYGPDYLLDHDVIYVGANFRLGPLGFFSTGQLDCPGNNGLKDQVQVLKWIQENIEAFGGDPRLVTIFGESAGGASATYHMMSPLSKGLFAKAISQSGVNLNSWAQPAHEGIAPKRAERLGSIVGCKKQLDNWNEFMECLRGKSAEGITAAFYDFFEWDKDPMIPFPPVIEPIHAGAFITKHPRDMGINDEPHSINVPWMTGLTSDEGALKSAPILNIDGLTKDFVDNYRKAIPISLNYDHHNVNVQEKITDEIVRFYFKGKLEFSRENDVGQQSLTDLFTDGWFLSGMDEYLRIRLYGSTSGNNTAERTVKVGPTYVYLFTHKGAASLTEMFKGGRENFYGTCHADDLQYLFPIAAGLFISAAPTQEDIQMREALTKMWVNFARTSDPTPPEGDLPKWEPASVYPLNYLRIGNKDCLDQPMIGMERGLMDKRVEFWRKLNAHSSARTTYHIKDEL